MKICYFGTFSKDYLRNRIIRKGLEQNGIQVVLCHTDYSWFLRVYCELFVRWLLLCKKDISVIIVGETNYVLMPLAKLIGFLWRKPVILDAFFSNYQTLVFDRKLVKENSFAAWKLRLIDKIGCMLADVILLDTNAHIEYFKKKFGLREKKFLRVLVGTDDSIFSSSPFDKDKGEMSGITSPFDKGGMRGITVLYWGTFIPLHGTRYIVEAAKLLEKELDIHFRFLGGGQMWADTVKLARELGLKNIQFLPFESEEKLVEEISLSDVCLGIFSDNEKAKMVIPHKVYQGLAMKKPVLTARTPAVEEVLKDKETALFCNAADPQSLADALMLLKNDGSLRERLAQNGYKLFVENFTPRRVVAGLMEYVNRKL